MTWRNSFLWLVVGLLLTVAQAQVAARNQNITGLVEDQSGAAIVDAQVDLRRTDGTQVAHTSTNGSGSFQFRSVPFGSYWSARLELCQ
jgi:Carboxypeptidase regulatory-like domain